MHRVVMHRVVMRVKSGVWLGLQKYASLRESIVFLIDAQPHMFQPCELTDVEVGSSSVETSFSPFCLIFLLLRSNSCW